MLGQVERKVCHGSKTVGDAMVSLMDYGVEVKIGNKSAWLMSYQTLLKVANDELLADLRQVLGDGPGPPLKDKKPQKDRPLDMKRLGKLIGPMVGKKSLTPATIRKYLKLLTIVPVGKHGKKPFYAPGVAERVADRYRQMQEEVSKKASARYDPKTRRLGSKRQTA